MDKKSARLRGLQNRAALSVSSRHEKSLRIEEHAISRIQKNDIVSCYVSMRDEVETDRILEYCFDHQIPIAVPKTINHTLEFYQIHSRNDLKKGNFGVEEPMNGAVIDPAKITLMFVPLSSFDESLNRTGYGKGYYDSILANVKLKIGLAFACQKVEGIDKEAHDIKLDEVIMEYCTYS